MMSKYTCGVIGVLNVFTKLHQLSTGVIYEHRYTSTTRHLSHLQLS